MAANRFWAGDASHSHRRQYSVMQMGWCIASMRPDGGSQIRAGTWAWQPETRRLPAITDLCHRGCFVVWQMCFSCRRSGLNETNIHRCPWMPISLYLAVIKAQSRRETNDIRLIVSSFRHSMRIVHSNEWQRGCIYARRCLFMRIHCTRQSWIIDPSAIIKIMEIFLRADGFWIFFSVQMALQLERA